MSGQLTVRLPEDLSQGSRRGRGSPATQEVRYRAPRVASRYGALVVLAEELETDLILTTDHRAFNVYRFGRGRPFRLLPSLG